jgi:hypothetical protein
MFTPNPQKAQEPVLLTPGKTFTLHLKPNTLTNEGGSNVRGPKDTRVVDPNGARTVLLSKAVRWRSTDEVKVEFNRDMTNDEAPEKYFADTQGEFVVSPEIQRVSFTTDPRGRLVKLYFEIA